MKCTKILSVLILIISYGSGNAQYTDVINSNRPGMSESAFSVGKNVLQFEAGAFSINEEHSTLDYDVSGFGLDFAIRYGLLFEELEIQLDGNYQNDTQTFTGGLNDVEEPRANFRHFTVGAKYLIYDPYKKAGEEKPNLYSYHANRRFKWKNLIPAVSIYAGANLDSENNPLVPYSALPQSNEAGFSPKVMIATQHNFNGGWVFVMNLINDRIGTDNSEFQYLLTLTHSFSPQWAVFGEAQGISGDFYADNIFRVGGAYLWTKDFQLDANVAFNTKDTPSVFNIAFGASYRFDFHKDEIDNGAPSADEQRERKAKQSKKREKRDDFDDDDNLKL